MVRFGIRKIFPLLALVVLLVVAGLLTLRATKLTFKGVGIKGVEIGKEGLVLKEIHLSEDDPQKNFKWSLDAREVGADKERTAFEFKDYTLRLVSQKNGEISLTGAEGMYIRNEKRFILNGEIKLISGQGYTAIANGVIFEESQGRIHVRNGVNLFGPDISVRGKEFRMEIGTGKFQIADNVVATLKDYKIGI